MVAPLIGWKAASILGGSALLGGLIQNRGAAQGAQAQADMMYQQGLQNVWNIEEMRSRNKGLLGEAIANRNFIRTGNEQRQKLAKDFGMFEAGPLARERGKSMVDATARMNALELGEDATALRKRKNWESLQNQLALRADEANRKWGFVPSRNPFGFGGTA
tara:strand:- start:200 stop:682 length:483 start_codon:yes stop_codon:yes gene_type:complete